MDPYVDTTDKKKKKKKSKKSKTATATTSSEPYDPYAAHESNVEMTAASTKSSSKKPKSEKKKKSKKASKQKDNNNDIEYATAYPVSEASGWKPLLARGINKEHAFGESGASTLKYAITGDESQIVTVSIPPGESCQGEPGSMMYLSDPIDMKVTCGSDWFGRCCGGESCCVVNFNNDTNTVGYAGLVTNDPLAKVVPVDMGRPSVGGNLIVQQGAYMASYGDVEIGFDCDCNLVRCCCGGMGLVRQKIKGSGTAFLGATGTIVQKVLEPNEVMLVDTNCLLAYAESCKFDLKRTGGLVGMFGGGEGIFNSSITGPGLVVIQSMNMCMLLESLAADKMYRR